jgi:hypothetical protein
MPIRQEVTQLLAFGFDSRNCVKCKGTSDNHKKMVVRIRKEDLAKFQISKTHDTLQIYVRVPEQESLNVDVGTCVNIETKMAELSFEVSSIHVLTRITSQTRFYRTAVLSGCFA